MDKKPVTFQMFSWAMGLMFILIGYLFTEVTKTIDQVNASTESTASVAGDIKVIKNNICWLMQSYPNHPPCN